MRPLARHNGSQQPKHSTRLRLWIHKFARQGRFHLVVLVIEKIEDCGFETIYLHVPASVYVSIGCEDGQNEDAGVMLPLVVEESNAMENAGAEVWLCANGGDSL